METPFNARVEKGSRRVRNPSLVRLDSKRLDLAFPRGLSSRRVVEKEIQEEQKSRTGDKTQPLLYSYTSIPEKAASMVVLRHNVATLIRVAARLIESPCGHRHMVAQLLYII